MANERIPEFLAGDVVLCPSGGKGDWMGQVIRSLQQTYGEDPTYATHTAQFIDSRTVLEMNYVVKVRTIEQFFEGRKAFEVWRCSSLTIQQREALAFQAKRYLNDKFGGVKLFTHLLDGLINKVVHKDVFFFRRLNHSDRYPICSWITAFAYDRALHYRFGVEPQLADPDQIHDWVESHSNEWARTFCMEEYLQRHKTSYDAYNITRQGNIMTPLLGHDKRY
jgi:hypothetical protein